LLPKASTSFEVSDGTTALLLSAILRRPLNFHICYEKYDINKIGYMPKQNPVVTKGAN
jgi:hypothetical protein